MESHRIRMLCIHLLQRLRQPIRLDAEKRLFDVVDTPGFLPIHESATKKRKEKRWNCNSTNRIRERQLHLSRFFDFSHPRLSADDLALFAAFHFIPHSCLFTIEEAAAEFARRFLKVHSDFPAAVDLQQLSSRYHIDPTQFDDRYHIGNQFLYKVRVLILGFVI